ncbi:hypothetical protein [Hyalangium sp.]|uniref:hypothetical protein n=1 Tax=Hyalangium sp. TaxID=2028555 RepID=UPI002D324E37|nr:hypothetical protein [Hyalangium sp.]HYH97425.1 hypothetical protein [Hyalangium sp.]
MDTPETQAAGGQPPEGAQSRWIRYLIFLALAFPAFLPFNYVYRFGVNVPFFDQWEFVPTLVDFYEGRLTLEALFAQHNEHRIFFPRLIMLGLAALTRWNTVAEMYFNAALLVALGAVLLHAHVRAYGASNRSLIAFLPIAWLVFTFRQYNNLIWGWQIQITLCVLFSVLSLLLLDGTRGLGARWAGATGAAFVASFSFGSGMAIWPVGLIALLWQGRLEGRTAWRAVLGWSVAGTLAVVLYTWNRHSNFDHPDPWTFLRSPGDSFLFMLGALGAVTADTFPTAMAFGALFLAGLGVIAFELRRRRVEQGPTTFALGLVLYAGAAAVLVLISRAGYGREYGLSSRYTTFTVLAFVGLHRALLALQAPERRSLLMGVVLSAAMISGFWSFTTGISEGLHERKQMRVNRAIVRTFATQPEGELQRLFPYPAVVRQNAPGLQRHELSVFAPGQEAPREAQ